MIFHIITIFPEMFYSYLKESIIGRAIRDKKIKVKFYNPRDYVQPPRGKKNKWFYRQVDDRPYGGGPGMVMMAEPLLKAVSKALGIYKKQKKFKIIIFAPSGEKFTTAYAKKSAQKYSDIIMICGRYEGIDARVMKVIKNWKLDISELSIGDYVLTGGELPAMVLVDSISRQIPGVLHKYESLEEERVSSGEVYTRPEVLKYKGRNYKVPKILLSGDHKKIEDWRKKHR